MLLNSIALACVSFMICVVSEQAVNAFCGLLNLRQDQAAAGSASQAAGSASTSRRRKCFIFSSLMYTMIHQATKKFLYKETRR